MNKSIGYLAVLMAAILWGTTGTVASLAPTMSPLLIGSVAMGIGGLLQGLMVIKYIVAERKLLFKYWRYLCCGALAVFIYPLAFYTSMRLSGVTIGTIISIGSAPILSAIIEYYFDDYNVTKQWLLGAFLGLFGILLLCLTDNHRSNLQTDYNYIGLLLGLVAGLTYALYSWSARQLMQKGITAKSAMGSTFGCGGLLLFPVLFFTSAELFASYTNFMVGAYMALIPMFLGYICYGYGLSKITASMATTITLIEPVVAALLAMFIVGEQLSLLGWIGITLIISCLIFITLPQRSLFAS